jgi:hypothetical protein
MEQYRPNHAIPKIVPLIVPVNGVRGEHVMKMVFNPDNIPLNKMPLLVAKIVFIVLEVYKPELVL